MLRDIVFLHWAHTPTIHAANHVDHEKRVAWFSISMHAHGSYSYEAQLAGSSAYRSSATNVT